MFTVEMQLQLHRLVIFQSQLPPPTVASGKIKKMLSTQTRMMTRQENAQLIDKAKRRTNEQKKMRACVRLAFFFAIVCVVSSDSLSAEIGRRKNNEIFR